MSIQIAVPISDITRTSLDAFREFHTESSGTTNLYQHIDDVILDTSDYIINPTPPATYVARLTSLSTPPNRDNHKVVFTVFQDPAGLGTTEASDITIEVRQGYTNESSLGTLIEGHTYTRSNGSIPNDGLRHTISFTISNANASNISDYTNLYVRIITDPHTEPDTFAVYNWYMTIPSPSQSSAAVTQFPSAPVFYGEVRTSGSTNGEPLCQLYNASSNKKVSIYELAFWGGGADGGSSTLCRADRNSVRRTGAPFSVGSGGTVTNGNIICLQGSSSPSATLKGIDFTNAQFYDLGDGVSCEFSRDRFFEVRPGATNQDFPFVLRPTLGYPLTLMPGSALEVIWRFNGVGFVVRLICLWSEELI